MSEKILGVGSRVKHPQMGKGVIVQIRSDAYEIGFIDFGVKQIMRDYQGLEIIEEVETPTDLATYEKIEKSLTRVLRRFSDIRKLFHLDRNGQVAEWSSIPETNHSRRRRSLLKPFFIRL